MKIVFLCKIEGCVSLEDILELGNQEWVGYDPDFSASAGGAAEVSITENNELIWETAWSRFSYKFKKTEEASVFVCVYEGAYRGFLSQALLPEIKVTEVWEASSNFGEVRNSGSLTNYQTILDFIQKKKDEVRGWLDKKGLPSAVVNNTMKGDLNDFNTDGPTVLEYQTGRRFGLDICWWELAGK